jgi:5'-3' exonuclease
MTTVLILDGYNLMHRARSGFMLGEYPVVFNFFRSLNTILEKFKPDRCIFTLDGEPVKNLSIFSDYKENIKIDPAYEKKILEMKNYLEYSHW